MGTLLQCGRVESKGVSQEISDSSAGRVRFCLGDTAELTERSRAPERIIEVIKTTIDEVVRDWANEAYRQ